MSLPECIYALLASYLGPDQLAGDYCRQLAGSESDKTIIKTVRSFLPPNIILSPPLENVTIHSIETYRNGLLHSFDDQPAIIKILNNTQLSPINNHTSFEWYKNGLKHRDNGPAVIDWHGSEWWKEGKIVKISRVKPSICDLD
jgi:hypothetical protein